MAVQNSGGRLLSSLLETERERERERERSKRFVKQCDMKLHNGKYSVRYVCQETFCVRLWKQNANSVPQVERKAVTWGAVVPVCAW